MQALADDAHCVLLSHSNNDDDVKVPFSEFICRLIGVNCTQTVYYYHTLLTIHLTPVCIDIDSIFINFLHEFLVVYLRRFSPLRFLFTLLCKLMMINAISTVECITKWPDNLKWDEWISDKRLVSNRDIDETGGTPLSQFNETMTLPLCCLACVGICKQFTVQFVILLCVEVRMEIRSVNKSY